MFTLFSSRSPSAFLKRYSLAVVFFQLVTNDYLVIFHGSKLVFKPEIFASLFFRHASRQDQQHRIASSSLLQKYGQYHFIFWRRRKTFGGLVHQRRWRYWLWRPQKNSHVSWFGRKNRKKVFYIENFSRERLKNMLENVKCEIISMSRNGQVDAYVLSESSMFISQRRFILKTCGTTTPLECIRDLLAMAKLFAGFDGIEVLHTVWKLPKKVPTWWAKRATLIFNTYVYIFHA